MSTAYADRIICIAIILQCSLILFSQNCYALTPCQQSCEDRFGGPYRQAQTDYDWAKYKLEEEKNALKNSKEAYEELQLSIPKALKSIYDAIDDALHGGFPADFSDWKDVLASYGPDLFNAFMEYNNELERIRHDIMESEADIKAYEADIWRIKSNLLAYEELYNNCYLDCLDEDNDDPVFVHSSRVKDITISGITVPYQFSPGSSLDAKDTIEISYTLPFKGYVTILIYDSANLLVRTVYTDQESYVGDNTFVWDGKDDAEVLLAEGTYRYAVIAHNVLNPNETYTETNEILIDNTPPLVVISQITGDYPEPGKTELRGTVQDANLECYTVEWPGTSLEKERYTGEVDNDILATVRTYSLLNGLYSVELAVTDLAGNSSMAQDTVNLTNQDTLRILDLSVSNNPISLLIAPGAGIFDTTTISYILSQTAAINVGIYDSGDVLVRQLASESQNPGLIEIVWDGNNDSGEYVPAGNYTVKISSGGVPLADEIITVTNNIGKITKPYEASLVRAYIPVTGTASCENFSHYTLEYGQGEDPTEWVILADSTEQVVNNILAMWDTGYNHPAYCTPEVNYPQEGLIGPYSLRLIVYDTFNTQYVDKITVKVGRVFSNEYEGEARSPDNKVHLTAEPLSLEHTHELISILPAAQPPETPHGLSLVGLIYELESPSINFSTPAVLTVSYLDGEILTLDETKLGIYEWDVLLQSWRYIPTAIDMDNNILTSQIFHTPLFRVYYAVFCDESLPQAPILYQPLSPANKLSVLIYGETDLQTRVEVFVNGQTQGISEIVRANWFTKEVILDEGVNHITAQAIDVADNTSNSSNQIDIEAVLWPPTTVGGIGGYESDFRTVITSTQAGGRLYIELIGEDSDPAKINTTTVLVTSSITDPSGILVTLTETGVNTGAYRGVIYIGTESNEATRTIGALDGEVITISSIVDPTKEISINVEDTISPGVPSIYSSTDPSICQNSFEDNLGNWRNRSGPMGASIYKDGTTSATGTFSAKMVNTQEGGDFSCYVLENSYQAEDYPIISFNYKISDEVKINFRVKANGAWSEIRFTDDPHKYDSVIKIIGEVQNVITDNEWHYAEINLYRMLKTHYPEETSFTVTEIIAGEWDRNFFYATIPGDHNPEGAVYWIDNFIITKPASQPFEINWTAPPEEPIVAGYSYLIDQAPNTIPDTISEGTGTSAAYDGLTDGIWYFHIRMQDNAGNWSLANHYLIMKE